MTTYRIAVGKRHKVEPRQIVGAIANEGGLNRGDFGQIRILPNFSLVDLPADLSQETLRRLDRTRISGNLIEIKPDAGPHGTGGGSRGKYQGGKGGPRHGGKPAGKGGKYGDDRKGGKFNDDRKFGEGGKGERKARKPRHK